jgi:tRNA nucleotidyltransferase (CCA-adding enzyme)
MDATRLEAAVPGAVAQICARLRDHGHHAWLVGGSVRDVLRGLTERVGDWDIATDARPEQVQIAFRRVIPTGLQHGTVTVLVDGIGYEVTTLRGETQYSDGRHPDRVFFVDDIEADLGRRDFTINAIAYDPQARRLIDPFGGVSDLEAGLIRAVGDPAARFAEDGLRVLRAARFRATLQMEIEAATVAAIQPSLASYRKVSVERVREEWMKALAAPAPSRAFEVMRDHGMLEITAPELCAGLHLGRVDVCPPPPLLRLAALMLEAGAPDAEAVLSRLRFSNRERDRVVALVRHRRVRYVPDWDDVEVRRWVQTVTPELVDDLCTLTGGEHLRARARQVLAARVPMSTRELAVDGNDLLQALDKPPGRWLGELLQRLLDEVVVAPECNQREALLARARELARRS